MTSSLSLTPDLHDAHARVAGIIGAGAEPLEVLECAEAHRAYWRPERIRVLLLAESHVYTPAHELLASLRPLPCFPKGMPLGFVRLVYSLGYGENELLTNPIREPRNSGTPQFWKIFQHCVRSPGESADHGLLQQGVNPSPLARLNEKWAVLTALRARGVWLVDASIAALYIPGAPKPALQMREQVLQASWDTYTGHVVAAAKPEAVLCIGVGVMRTLSSRLDRLGIPWLGVPQPQAHLSSDDHAEIHDAYARVCTDPGEIGRLRRWG